MSAEQLDTHSGWSNKGMKKAMLLMPTLLLVLTACAPQVPTLWGQSQPQEVPKAEATAAAEAVQSTVEPLSQTANLEYVPASGYLNQHAVKMAEFPGAPANFIVEAEFTNPWDRAIGGWDHGFSFRSTYQEQYTILLTSEPGWTAVLDERTDEGHTFTQLGHGVLRELDISPLGKNSMRIVVHDESAFLYVNDNYVATVDVSRKTQPGGIMARAGYYSWITDYQTQYDNFTVWSLP